MDQPDLDTTDLIQKLEAVNQRLANLSNLKEMARERQKASDRLFFAAHAPPVPMWFVHVEEPRPKPPPMPAPTPEGLTGAERSAAVEAHNEEYRRLQPERDAHLKLVLAWNDRDNMRRLVQWAWAYADAMIAGASC